ncbi:hypothetical protein P154DRAFT_526233 [Amniculicola lignicola CBS 123094]|uniref:Mitochondrial protein from FMP27-domain-containing protein n=1 Tax=Amniculicola lignicola CBS 123094 TaxID=1392246 RepID=A0A6A5W183_9PLEO|nr:hypothetical protein P154DRAFT_526233 [Amniculicola lignicola CBS 123094]
MALPHFSFMAGLVLLAYLSSFVFFAFIRVVTGVSIQRLGLSGLRRIAFTPKDGIRIEIRGLGITLHRPTFAQPTWLSVVLTELKVTVDLRRLREKPRKKKAWGNWGNGVTEKLASGQHSPAVTLEEDGSEDTGDDENPRSRTWERLTAAKEKIKRLHRQIKWIRLVDLVASTTTVVVVDVGAFQIGNFSMAVDTRRKTVDRSRLFNHHKPNPNKEQRPAEWFFVLRSILFTPEGNESTEILDHCTLNIHGMLYKELDGLRDASIALKLGRLSIPYDDIQMCVDRAKKCHAAPPTPTAKLGHPEISIEDVMDDPDVLDSREEHIAQTVSDSKDFASSILRGIQEFQFAVSFFGLTTRIKTAQMTAAPVYLNVSMKEVGMDLLRLDPRSPAHLMYFSPNDIAHQALLAAISLSVGIDDGHGHPERLLYLPMATMTLNTTLPSKTIQFSKDKNVAERNTNILFANLVITSPSLDLAPKHLPLVLALFQSYESHHRKPPGKKRPPKRTLLRRLLPKANIKISIHEPVIRITLPPMEPEKQGTDEFDLLISASSSVSLDMESSHAADGELHYALISTFRMNSQQLYYQTASSEKHNLLLTDHLEFKLQLSASPDVVVTINGNAQTFSVYVVRPEISEGLRQIVMQLQKDVRRRRGVPKGRGNSFVRKLPSWLAHVYLQGSDFNIEVAGTDSEVSKHARGLGLHLESWTAEYRQSRGDETEARPARRRAPSRTINRDEYLLRPTTPSSPRKQLGDPTDGRRLAIHLQGFEGYVLEAADTWEQDPFLSLPRMEVAFSTSSDKQGPVFHINSYIHTLFFQYSLYRHFAIGVATVVLRRSFNWSPDRQQEPASPLASPQSPYHLRVPSLDGGDFDPTTGLKREHITFDIKSHFVQIKADMPSDPPLMLHVYGLETGRHRWRSPFLTARLVRIYAECPQVRRVWCRVVSVKSLRMDYRQSKRKYGNTVTEEKSFDVVTDAIRIAVPHQLVMHQVFDNITNVAKTIKQLHYRFQTGRNDYILSKEPEGPKHIPKISLRCRAMIFEIEDGSFEWKLGVIYRYGLMEQKQRIAREHAFDLKVKKLEQEAEYRGSSRLRAKSAHTHRGRSKSRRKDKDTQLRSKSEDHGDHGSPNRRAHDHPMRYDKQGFSGLSGNSRTSIKEARERLNRLNAQTWRKRIDHALTCQSRNMDDIRSIFWGLDEIPDDIEHKENIMSIPHRPALAVLILSDLDVVLDKPSFPLTEYPEFLNRVGKGMPLDMQYSLLIPTHVQINVGEAKLQLRDYPLPLVHVPAIKPNQSSRLPSLTLKTDFVIAEEFRDVESSRVCNVVVVPEETTPDGKASGGYSVNVRRTVAPVKTYSDMKIDINSAYPTRITWGTSYQPAIQDMMQVIENFTKPAVDPSERVGFWDKIRLTFHSRFDVSWKGDGDVHLILKGSRDPYMVTGHGAGFVMCWQNDVRLTLAEDQDPRNFMVVNSGSYVLAIPDLGHYARQEAEVETTGHSETTSSISSYKQLAMFKKTVMKLNGNVRWVAGLVFERNCDEGGRSFDFIPHYDIVLKNPEYAKPHNGRQYDAFRGFRSHHIHMSVAVAAPYDREWSVSNLEPSRTYNSVHLTPRFFTHFFNWWSMFSGAMSLPIRQGKLWPGVEKSSKKFGRHLATIKYNLLLSPLYMSHVYKHKDAEDYGSGVVSATGLKARLDSFMFDLHQRREEFRTVVQAPQSQEDSKQNQTTGMRINQVQLDLIRTDVRAVSASVGGTDADDVREASAETVAGYNQEHASADLSKFYIPDNDWGWVDMDDFVELGWMLPSEQNPDTKILPLAFAPRFTYFRQTDHSDNISGDPHRTSPFGNEPTHHCVMSARNDPRRVQCHLIEQRLQRVRDQIAQNERTIGEVELKRVREVGEPEELEQRLGRLRNHAGFLKKKEEFLLSMYESLLERLDANDLRAVPDPALADHDEDDEYFEAEEQHDPSDSDTKEMGSTPVANFISDFNNRFIIHNVHLKWSNSLRNIILRYIHQVSQRRGFIYYMSRRAVKFILDIVEEQNKSRQPSGSGQWDNAFPKNQFSQEDDELSVHDRVTQLLADGKKFVDANDPDNSDGSKARRQSNAGDDIAVDYVAQNSYIVRLIAPQVQLQSEKNKKAAVLVTAKGMQLKVVQIMDKDRVMDEVSGLVQRRFSAAMDSLQIFVTNAKTYTMEDIHMYSGSSYGTPAGSAWPPWVPFEVMFEFKTTPYGFQRVVQRTSASMRYDKYNTLRLKYNDNVSGGDSESAPKPDNAESRIDHLYVDFPHVRALCNSRQYYAMYVIVLDLLLYSEPLEKTRTERLEKIMLASDFSDLSGAPALVISLQERIRQLEEIKTMFQINEKYLDKQGWNDRIEVEKDLAIFEDELFFMMKAITTAQRKADDRAHNNSQSTGLLRWYISASEIVWHLLQEGHESLAEFRLTRALYDRTDNNDGSNINSMEIEQITGLNLLPTALYPEMISPFIDNTRPFTANRDTKMLRVHWVMLEAIAGIPVMDHFEVNLFPLKVQLEREIAKKLFEYIFPGIRDNNRTDKDFSPFMVKHMVNTPGDNDDGDQNGIMAFDRRTEMSVPDNDEEAESLKLRLTPTLTLRESHAKPSSASQTIPPIKNVHHLRLFRNDTSRSGYGWQKSLHPSSANGDSAPSLSSRPMSMRSNSNMSVATTDSERTTKRFALYRSGSSDKQKKVRSDDLTQMMNRASNYMTLAYVKIPSMVLCLSYKGKGQRNFEDVHDLVFRMPTLEYRNKTWSNLDLALQLKKDVVRALISHAGAIVGNKFTHRRANKQTQSRLRQIANSSTLLHTSPDLSGTDSNSIPDHSPGDSDASNDGAPRRSFTSGRGSMFSHVSEGSSLRSGRSGITSDFAGSTYVGNWRDDPSIIEDGRGFADELSRVDQTEPEHANMISTLSRHLSSVKTGLSGGSRDTSVGPGDETDESSKKKSKMTLAKNFLTRHSET